MYLLPSPLLSTILSACYHHSYSLTLHVPAPISITFYHPKCLLPSQLLTNTSCTRSHLHLLSTILSVCCPHSYSLTLHVPASISITFYHPKCLLPSQLLTNTSCTCSQLHYSLPSQVLATSSVTHYHLRCLPQHSYSMPCLAGAFSQPGISLPSQVPTQVRLLSTVSGRCLLSTWYLTTISGAYPSTVTQYCLRQVPSLNLVSHYHLRCLPKYGYSVLSQACAFSQPGISLPSQVPTQVRLLSTVSGMCLLSTWYLTTISGAYPSTVTQYCLRQVPSLNLVSHYHLRCLPKYGYSVLSQAGAFSQPGISLPSQVLTPVWLLSTVSGMCLLSSWLLTTISASHPSMVT